MLLRRPKLTPLETWMSDLQLWAISQGATVWIIDLDAYEPCTVAGIPVHWTIEPTEGFVEATLFDGTGEIVARWPLTRRPSPLQVASQGRGVEIENLGFKSAHPSHLGAPILLDFAPH